MIEVKLKHLKNKSVINVYDGNFLEFQIKARSPHAKQAGCFTVDNHTEQKNNFYFVFYSEIVNTRWVFKSEEFIKNSQLNKNGKHSGRRKITLVTSKGNISKKYESFVKEDFGFLINAGDIESETSGTIDITTKTGIRSFGNK